MTPLNRSLEANHGKRIAVPDDGSWAVGSDSASVGAGAAGDGGSLAEEDNGCIYCARRGDLIARLRKLIGNSKETGRSPDGVVIEGTSHSDMMSVTKAFAHECTSALAAP